MNNDFSKLTSYVNEKNSPASIIEDKFLNAKTTVFNFFNHIPVRNGSNLNLMDYSNNTDDQNDNWFKDAETDPYCPKLVSFVLIMINLNLNF